MNHNFLFSIFTYLNKEFLFHEYFIGLIIFVINFLAQINAGGIYLYNFCWIIISLIVFPFTAYVWNKTISIIFGNVLFSHQGCIFLIFVIIKNVILFIFSPIIGIPCILYIGFKHTN